MAAQPPVGPQPPVPPTGGPPPPPPPPSAQTTAKIRQFAPKQLKDMEAQARAEGWKTRSLFNRGSQRYLNEAFFMQRSTNPEIKNEGFRRERDYILYLNEFDQDQGRRLTRHARIRSLNAQISSSTSRQQTTTLQDLPRYAAHPLDLTKYDIDQQIQDMDAQAVYDGFIAKGRVLHKDSRRDFGEHINSLANSRSPQDQKRAMELIGDYYSHLQRKHLLPRGSSILTEIQRLDQAIANDAHRQKGLDVVLRYQQLQYDSQRGTPFAIGGPLSDRYEDLMDEGLVTEAHNLFEAYFSTLNAFPLGQQLAPAARALHTEYNAEFEKWNTMMVSQQRADERSSATLTKGPVSDRAQGLIAQNKILEAHKLCREYLTWLTNTNSSGAPQTSATQVEHTIQRLTQEKWDSFGHLFSKDEAESQLRHDIAAGQLFALTGPLRDKYDLYMKNNKPAAEALKKAYKEAIQNTRFGKQFNLGIELQRQTFNDSLATADQQKFDEQTRYDGYSRGPNPRGKPSPLVNPNIEDLEKYYTYVLFNAPHLSPQQRAYLTDQKEKLAAKDPQPIEVWEQTQIDIREGKVAALQGVVMQAHLTAQSSRDPQKKETARELIQAYVKALEARPDSQKHTRTIQELKSYYRQEAPELFPDLTPEQKQHVAELQQGSQTAPSQRDHLLLLQHEYLNGETRTPQLRNQYLDYLLENLPDRAVSIQVMFDEFGWHSEGPIAQTPDAGRYTEAQRLYAEELQRTLPLNPLTMRAQAIHDGYARKEPGEIPRDDFAKKIEELLRSQDRTKVQEGQQAVLKYYEYLLNTSSITLSTEQRAFINERVQATQQTVDQALALEFLALRWQQTHYDITHGRVTQQGPLHQRYRELINNPNPTEKHKGRMLLSKYITTARSHPLLSKHPNDIARLEKLLRIPTPPLHRFQIELDGQLAQDCSVETGATGSNALKERAAGLIASDRDEDKLMGYQLLCDYYKYAASQGHFNNTELGQAELKKARLMLKIPTDNCEAHLILDQRDYDAWGMQPIGPIAQLAQQQVRTDPENALIAAYQAQLTQAPQQEPAAPQANALTQQLQELINAGNRLEAANLLATHYEEEIKQLPRGEQQKKDRLYNHIEQLRNPDQDDQYYPLYAYLQFQHDQAQGQCLKQGPLWDEYNRIWNQERGGHAHDPHANNLAQLYFRDLEMLHPRWNRQHKAEIDGLKAHAQYNIQTLGAVRHWEDLFRDQRAIEQDPNEPLFSPKGPIGYWVLWTNRGNPTERIPTVELYLKGLKAQGFARNRGKEIAAWENWARKQKASPTKPIPFPAVPAVPIAATVTLAPLPPALFEEQAQCDQNRPLFDLSGPVGNHVRLSSISNPASCVPTVLQYLENIEKKQNYESRKQEIAEWRKWATKQLEKPAEIIPFPKPPREFATLATSLSSPESPPQPLDTETTQTLTSLPPPPSFPRQARSISSSALGLRPPPPPPSPSLMSTTSSSTSNKPIIAELQELAKSNFPIGKVKDFYAKYFGAEFAIKTQNNIGLYRKILKQLIYDETTSTASATGPLYDYIKFMSPKSQIASLNNFLFIYEQLLRIKYPKQSIVDKKKHQIEQEIQPMGERPPPP